MQFSPQYNPITDRIKVITKHWTTFAKDPDARICRWKVESDEVRMIEAFIKRESANEAETDDYFLSFRPPFDHYDDYAILLNAVIQEEIEVLQKQFNEEVFKTPASNSTGFKIKNAPSYFLNQLSDLRTGFLDFPGHLVAVLLPGEIADTKGYLKWLEQVIKNEIPDNVRFLVIDLDTAPFYQALAEKYPRLIHTIEPNLDMDGAMKELASAGDPRDPGVKFRKLLVEMSQHAAKGRIKEMERTGEAAIAVATQQGWQELQTNTYFLMASGYLRTGDKEKSIATYDKAALIAATGWQDGDDLCAKLLVQILLCKGSVFFGEKDYEMAREIYTNAIAPADDVKFHMGHLEARRMIATCYDFENEKKEAWKTYMEALDIGEHIDAEFRSSSTLPYVGAALVRIADDDGKDKVVKEIEEKMEELCGADWKKKVRKGV